MNGNGNGIFTTRDMYSFQVAQRIMDSQFPSLQFLLSFFLFVFLLVKLQTWSKSKKLGINLPPGPFKLPLIGNMHLLVGSLPHIALRNLSSKYGPVMYLQLGQVPTIIVSSPDAAKEVMKTHDVTFASRPELLAAKIMSYGCKDIAFSPYGEYWRMLRKICITELLSQKRVQSFRSLREEEILKLARWIASNEGSPVNLTQKTYSSTYGLTSRAAFGKKTDQQEMLVSLIQESIGLASGFDIADVYPSVKLLQVISGTGSRLRKLQQKADRILENIINEHKIKRLSEIDDRREDLVDVLLKFQEDGAEIPLTTDSIKAVILVSSVQKLDID